MVRYVSTKKGPLGDVPQDVVCLLGLLHSTIEEMKILQYWKFNRYPLYSLFWLAYHLSHFCPYILKYHLSQRE